MRGGRKEKPVLSQPGSCFHPQDTIFQLLSSGSLHCAFSGTGTISRAYLQISAVLTRPKVRLSLKRDLNTLYSIGRVLYLPRHPKVPTGQSGHIALSAPCALNWHGWRVSHEPKPASMFHQMQQRQIALPLSGNLLIDRFYIKWGKPCSETALLFYLGKFGQIWEMILQKFSKIIECVCFGTSLTTFYVLQSLNNCISYVIPNRDWKFLCVCVRKCIHTCIHTQTCVPPTPSWISHYLMLD